MPAILDRSDYAVWLTGAPAVARTVLKSFPSQQMIAHPVSPRINSFRYDDDQLIRPGRRQGTITTSCRYEKERSDVGKRWTRCAACALPPLALLSALAACSNGTGSVDEQPPPAQAEDSFAIGGTVSGLVGSGLVLQNNGGGNLPVAADGSFAFAERLASGVAYNVTVLSQPTSPSQSCTVASGSGSVGSDDISNLAVTCATGQFAIRGTVSGLTGSGLVLQNNGGNDLRFPATACFPSSIASPPARRTR